jgi:hypothetical protein
LGHGDAVLKPARTVSPVLDTVARGIIIYLSERIRAVEKGDRLLDYAADAVWRY